MNTDSKIRELQDEIKRLRKLGRTKRQPVKGIGGAIQWYREAEGIGLRQLAAAAGISAGILSRLEQQPYANPTFHTLEKIAKGLKLKTASLVELINRP